jgi:hypothetical protein
MHGARSEHEPRKHLVFENSDCPNRLLGISNTYSRRFQGDFVRTALLAISCSSYAIGEIIGLGLCLFAGVYLMAQSVKETGLK